jgi:protein-S-isoprenylcysteine O-methyltransferase Ste14
MTHSLRVVAAALVGIPALLLVPFAEEVWLAEKLGEPYAQYQRMVPRFLSIKSLSQQE